MKTEIQILEEARAKIADPKNWTKGMLWRDVDGYRVSPKGNPARAVCFCAVGAIRVVANDDMETRAIASGRLYNAINDGAERWSDKIVIADWNDAPTTTHEMVLAAFDKAIAQARESASVAA